MGPEFDTRSLYVCSSHLGEDTLSTLSAVLDNSIVRLGRPIKTYRGSSKGFDIQRKISKYDVIIPPPPTTELALKYTSVDFSHLNSNNSGVTWSIKLHVNNYSVMIYVYFKLHRISPIGNWTENWLRTNARTTPTQYPLPKWRAIPINKATQI